MATYDARPSGFTQLTTTSDWESFLSSSGIQDGIDGPNGFIPSLDTGGRNAVIGAGQCLIKGQLWRADAAVNTPIPAASAQNRLDRLVIQLNRGATSSPTVIQPVVITGTPSGSPVLPPLTQGATGIFQIPVSYWTSASSGALSGLVDQRQYSGRSVAMMTSAYRPSLASPCAGFETDTSNLLYWNGSTWAYISSAVAVASAVPQTISSTSAVTVTGCVLPVLPGAWEIRASGTYVGIQSAGNPVFQIGTGSLTMSQQWGNGYTWDAAGASAGANRFTSVLGGLGPFPGTVMSPDTYVFQLDCCATFTNAGSISLQAYTNTAGDTFSIKAAKLTAIPV